MTTDEATPDWYEHDGGRWVYFIQSGPGGAIKIGAARVPKRRMEMLQTGNPRKLTLLGTCRGGFAREVYLQRQMRAHHIRGEWFWPTDEVLAMVKECIAEGGREWVPVPRLRLPNRAQKWLWETTYRTPECPVTDEDRAMAEERTRAYEAETDWRRFGRRATGE